MPGIDDQDDSLAAALIPNFVVERVVEDETLPFPPFVAFLADSNARAFRHDNPKMAP
jgi:hypothetical protein